MPEYIPQMGSGLLQEIIRLAATKNDAMANAYQNMGANIGGGLASIGQHIAQRRQNYLQNTTPIPKAPTPAPAGGQAPFGDSLPNGVMMADGKPVKASQPATQTAATPPPNPMEIMQKELAPYADANGRIPNHILTAWHQTRGQELGFQRAIEVAGIKSAGDLNKTHTAATQSLLDAHPELAKIFKSGEMVPNRMVEQQIKPNSMSASLDPDKLSRTKDWMAGNMDKITMKQASDPKFIRALSDMLDRGVTPNPIQMEGMEKKQLAAAGAQGKGELDESGRASLEWGVQNKLISTDMIKARGAGSGVLASLLGKMKKGEIPKQNLMEGNAMAKAMVSSAVYGSSGKAQDSARAAQTVIKLTDGLQKASDEFKRVNVRFANTAINSLSEQSGTGAMTLKQYLVDTRSKMATALQGGGMPTDMARRSVDENFPDTITAAQMPKAIENIKDIMHTQIEGALTPVTLNPKEGEGGAGKGGKVGAADFVKGLNIH